MKTAINRRFVGFNMEFVTRVIFNSKISIVSWVGCKIDFIISGFGSDVVSQVPFSAVEIV
ncbi:MAG: hypothetical protein LBL77_02630 [Endomicrobium sp.]|nr:hypothetical protein [Endomicrobium sp.]